MGRNLGHTLALCTKHRVSRLVDDGETLTVEFFAPADRADAKRSAPARGEVTNPARAPEVEEAVAALDRAYEIDDDEPVRDTAAIIAEIDAAAKAGG